MVQINVYKDYDKKKKKDKSALIGIKIISFTNWNDITMLDDNKSAASCQQP